MKIVLENERPMSANLIYSGQGGWRLRHKEAERVHKMVYYLCMEQMQDSEPPKAPVRIRFTTYLASYGKKDTDNFTWPKMYIDGLVQAGAIPSDTAHAVAEIVLQCRLDEASPRVEIIIEEYADE